MAYQRPDARALDQLRDVTIQRRFTSAPGSVLIQAGNTMALCAATIVEDVPDWMKRNGQNPTKGWITAEYRMLPESTLTRKPRMDRPDGRSTEIQRMIGRALRAVFDPEALGPRTVYLDCDILQADGGTRTLCITGACVALIDALNSVRDKLPEPERYPLKDSVSAVSVGLIQDEPILDLAYVEDSAAQVDMNVVLTRSGDFVELQGAGEKSVFNQSQLSTMIAFAQTGCARLAQLQQASLGEAWPFS
ncbi:MAG: ribonuclease PH [Planctomycetia bacterium]|nr:ribonuclease PH [Planctomycetia bacterium]